jgi:hypothetical protein
MAQVALGLKAHSGWAALVALGAGPRAVQVVDRRRLELVDPAEAYWAKQPYHAAEGLDADEAERVVARAIDSARKLAKRELAAVVKELGARGHQAVACGVLLGTGMPAWSVAEILAVHMRMHKAEGELFRDVLVRAGEACGLRVAGVPERELAERASKTLKSTPAELAKRVGELGKPIGPPWAKDQREAALAAWIALRAA